jgi:uncharacterized Fe-S center protein
MKTGRIKNVIDKIRSDKEFFGWIAAIVIGTITALGWFSANFVTTVKAEEMMKNTKNADAAIIREIKDLTVEVVKSNKSIKTHLSSHDLQAVLDRLRETETQMFNIRQFTRVNGSDAQSEERLRNLENDLKHLTLKRDCIINDNPLCD